MNMLLWIAQIALALLSLSGGAYKVFMFEELAKVPTTAALPQGAWGALGVFEMVCAILLIVPAITKWKPFLTPLAAVALTVEGLAMAVMYAGYSLAPVATNPLLWVVVIALMAAFVAYGRFKLKPLA